MRSGWTLFSYGIMTAIVQVFIFHDHTAAQMGILIAGAGGAIIFSYFFEKII